MTFKVSSKIADYIWINGEFVTKDTALVHAATHSLHYSGAVFEGQRAYNGEVFKLIQHTERLIESAKSMHISISYSVQEINEATKQVLLKNNLQNAYVRPLIWRGPESITLFSKDLSSNLLVFATDSNPPFENGLNINIGQWRKPNPNSMPPQSKSSAHYAMGIVSQDLAISSGYDDSLLLDFEDNIAECTTTNIFFGKDYTLITPIADRFLNGITRKTVIEIASNMGLKVIEKRLKIEDIIEFDICFQTGTSVEIKGIASIDIGSRKLYYPNISVIEQLQQTFAKTIGKKI